MFYKRTPDPPQVRFHCRNPRCGAKLKIPTDNPRDAFCCAWCERHYHNRRCRVCGDLFTRKTVRRVVCSRAKCQSAFRRHPEDFFGTRYPYSPVTDNASRSAHSTGLKTGLKSGRGWVVIAGPAGDLHPINLRPHPADSAAMRTGRPGPVLFTRSTPPLNIIGGYKFPGAPKVDLFEEPTTSTEPEGAQ